MANPKTPEDFGKLFASSLLQDKFQINKNINNIPKLLEWSDAELTTFFQSFLHDYEIGMRDAIEEQKFWQSENAP